jgi:hypothetical protein
MFPSDRSRLEGSLTRGLKDRIKPNGIRTALQMGCPARSIAHRLRTSRSLTTQHAGLIDVGKSSRADYFG